jgi:hypothetical protein
MIFSSVTPAGPAEATHFDSFSPLEVSGDVSNVDFGTGLRTVILSQSADTVGGGNYQRLSRKRAER